MTAAKNTRAVFDLAIQPSWDEPSAAFFVRHGPARGEILSKIVRAPLDEHAAFGGVVPEIAARAHVEVLDVIIQQAMEEAGCGWDDPDGVAGTGGPGVAGGLLRGLHTAKAVGVGGPRAAAAVRAVPPARPAPPPLPPAPPCLAAPAASALAIGASVRPATVIRTAAESMVPARSGMV